MHERARIHAQYFSDYQNHAFPLPTSPPASTSLFRNPQSAIVQGTIPPLPGLIKVVPGPTNNRSSPPCPCRVKPNSSIVLASDALWASWTPYLIYLGVLA